MIRKDLGQDDLSYGVVRRGGKGEMGRSFQTGVIACGKSRSPVTTGNMGCPMTGVGTLDLPEHFMFL